MTDILKDLGRTDKLGGTLKNKGGAHEAMGSAVEDGKIEPDNGPLTHFKDNKLGQKLKNKGGAHEKFEGGGNVAPMKGEASLGESLWAPEHVSTVIGENELDVMALLEAYADANDIVTLEGFNALLEANGSDVRLDQAGIRMLMDQSESFVFHESNDANGLCYLRESIVGTDAVPVEGAAEIEDEEEALEEDFHQHNRSFPRPGVSSTAGQPGPGLPGAGPRAPGLGMQRPLGDPTMDTQVADQAIDQPIDTGLGGGGLGDEGFGAEVGGGGYGEADGQLGGGDDGFEDNQFGLTADDPNDSQAQDQLGAYGAGGHQGRAQPGALGHGGVNFDDPYAEDVAAIMGRDIIAEDVLGTVSRIVVTQNPEVVMSYCARYGGNLSDPATTAMYCESAPIKIGLDGLNNVVAIASTTFGLYDNAERPIHSEAVVAAFDSVPQEEGEYHFAEEGPCEQCNEEDCECEAVAEDVGNDNFHMTDSGRTNKLGGTLKNKGGMHEKAGNSPEGKAAEASDGITTELRPSSLGQKLKNKGGQHEKFEGGGNVAPMKGGTSTVHENVSALNAAVRPALSEAARKLPGKKCYQAVAEGVKTAPRVLLSEALVDAEELIQVLGEGAVNLRVASESHHVDIALTKVLKRRGPVVSEGQALFRHAAVARRFADRLVSEGRIARIQSHNFGAAVRAKLSFGQASKVFQSL